MNDLVLARNCCMARMLPGEAELVSECTGLPGRAKSVGNTVMIFLYVPPALLTNPKMSSAVLWFNGCVIRPVHHGALYSRTRAVVHPRFVLLHCIAHYVC